jgi:hypothetical protein
VPRANLLYSTRNKILATSLLVEASSSTKKADPARHQHRYWEVKPEDVADHCNGLVTRCRPAQSTSISGDDHHAQPVAQDGPEEFPPGQRRGHVFSERHQPETIKVMRTAMVVWALSSVWPTTC